MPPILHLKQFYFFNAIILMAAGLNLFVMRTAWYLDFMTKYWLDVIFIGISTVLMCWAAIKMMSGPYYNLPNAERIKLRKSRPYPRKYRFGMVFLAMVLTWAIFKWSPMQSTFRDVLEVGLGLSCFFLGLDTLRFCRSFKETV